MIRSAFLFAALLSMPALSPAQIADAPIGLFTIVDGEVTVLRETHALAATEGTPLRSEDIVRSRETAHLARIELDDGTLLDLGPATELLLRPRALATPGEAGVALYLLRGWLKISAASTTASGGIALLSPQIALARLSGSVVVHATAQASVAFVESGHASALDRIAARPAAPLGLNDGDAFVVRPGVAGASARRPPADTMNGLPRAFADTLPRRAAQWRGRSAAVPAPLGEPDYAELAPWLHAEPALRGPFVKRFGPLARDRQFRSGLLANLSTHPEWGRVLFPEKYRARAAATALAAHRPGTPPMQGAKPPATTRNSNGMLAAPPPAAERTNPESAIAQAPRTEMP